jgi:hypothetical protein
MRMIQACNIESPECPEDLGTQNEYKQSRKHNTENWKDKLHGLHQTIRG